MDEFVRFRPRPPWFTIALGCIGGLAGAIYHGPLAKLLVSKDAGTFGEACCGALIYGMAYVVAALVHQRDRRTAHASPEVAAARLLQRTVVIAVPVGLVICAAMGRGSIAGIGIRWTASLDIRLPWLSLRLPWLGAAVDALMVWLTTLPAVYLAAQCASGPRERNGSLAAGWFRARVSQTLLISALTIPWFAASHKAPAVMTVSLLMLATLPVTLEALARWQLTQRVAVSLNAVSGHEVAPWMRQVDLDYGFGDGGAVHQLCRERDYRRRPAIFHVQGNAEASAGRLRGVLGWSCVGWLIGALQLLVLLDR